MSIMSYNGSATIAMQGKDCCAIASDLRFGIQLQTVSMDFTKVFQMGPRLFVGFPGLATDTQTVYEKLKFRKELYELRENRCIRPKTLMTMATTLLYERRFGPYFVEPTIAGLDPITNEPFIGNMDLIGCPNISKEFVVGGTCNEQLFGMCETLWEPNMDADHLFESISQAMLNAVDRDCFSGWGARVYLIEQDQVTISDLKARMD